MRWLIGSVLTACFVVGASALGAQEIRKMDLNGDGYRESQMVYLGTVPIKGFVDANGDGYPETVLHYRNGYRDRVESDLNGDGRPERWIYYYFTGVPWKVAEDLDRDGKPDYWAYLRDGAIYRWEQDRNGDGKADVRTTYEEAVPAEARALVQQSYDDDFDGVFENLSGATMIRKQANLPQSWAEAFLR